ncbi:MAG: DUF4954 family protein [Candidatus Cryptobacteroides sp.]|jgi:hypothetical protein
MMKNNLYRNLTPKEIDAMESVGCSCKRWENVLLNAEFQTWEIERAFRNVIFSGTCRLGTFRKSFELPGGLIKPSGIRNATLHNVTVGNDCCIENIANYIANYEIGHDTLIENVDIIVVDRITRFGNGIEVSVLDETGGRKVIITNRLSAQLAYMMTLYRHLQNLQDRLRKISLDYANAQSSDTGRIGNFVSIQNTGSITAVKVGDHCVIKGAGKLKNGSINSNEAAPVRIGYGVVAEDFIIASGTTVDDNTTVYRCFIGQNCTLGNGYSANNSLFFSNCLGKNGEACSIFAGPFTVTHHKSTLLIAGMFSFMNAGAGSSQSNHMYKLGPIHQGILERGAKTASDSYILWPSRVGAFSLVMGRHVTHSDTSGLPFSYLIEKNNTTFLVPGVNLKSVGTVRDAQKWPRRDERKDPDRIDQVNYNLLSPYTIQKMFKGRKTLKNLQSASGMLTDVYSFHSAKIQNSALVKGIEYYETGIRKFLGNSLITRLQGMNFSKLARESGTTAEEIIRKRLVPDYETGSGEWVDLSGLIAPKSAVEALIVDIEAGKITSIDAINAVFQDMHRHYYDYEWTWAYDKIREFFEIDMGSITLDQVRSIVNQWKDAVIGLDKMLYEDARKEFSLASMTGFGADGNQEEKQMDFEQVRGAFESNPFVTAVVDHIATKSALGDELLSRLK